MGWFKDRIRWAAASAFAGELRRRSRELEPIDGVVLVIAPHPDDETLGCGGLIARQAAAGRRVHVVFVTDGEASHPGHPALTSAALASQRQAEALAALETLGVANPRSAATFLGAPDGRLDRLDPAERPAVGEALRKWIKADQPAVVCAPFHGGGSTEHDATCGLVREALAASGGGVLLEYPVWAWWNAFRLRRRLRGRAAVARLALGSAAGVKRRALARHRSQVEPTPPWREPRLPPVLAALCTRADEFYFPSRVDAGA